MEQNTKTQENTAKTDFILPSFPIMTTIDKLKIQGIRAFNPSNTNTGVIEFEVYIIIYNNI